jgi:hypothetical protein
VDQRRVARLVDVLQRSHEEGVRLASPRGAPEQCLAVGAHEELGLLGGGLVEDVGVLDDGLGVDPQGRQAGVGEGGRGRDRQRRLL